MKPRQTQTSAIPHLNGAYGSIHTVALHKTSEDHVIVKSWVIVVNVKNSNDELLEESIMTKTMQNEKQGNMQISEQYHKQ